MELVIAFMSALIGLSAAFFLSISFYDLRLEDLPLLTRSSRAGGPDVAGIERQPLLPRTIRHTLLD